MANLMEEALRYADKGWYVFPCREKPGDPYIKNGVSIERKEKSPYTFNGLLSATKDKDQIRAWWDTWENAMIGVNAGMSGLFVVDIDKKHVDGFEEFSKWNINDEGGYHTTTPSGGMHIIFKGEGKTKTDGKVGIDTRGEGGYFIAPPSKILEGEYIGEYKRFDDWTKKLGVIPDGLMKKLFPTNTTEYVRGNRDEFHTGKYKLARASLEFTVNGAEPGERNISLFTTAKDFAGCGYDLDEAKRTLYPVSRRIGLDDGEIEATILKAYSRESTPSIPFSIQKKMMSEDENIAGKITYDEQVVMEDAILACILQDNNLIPIIHDILRTEDFQVLKNRYIFSSILDLYNLGTKADYLTVLEDIRHTTDKIELDDISSIIDKYHIDVDNAISYAKILREKASFRKLEALMDNKRDYLKIGSLNSVIGVLEKDISDIALYGGAHSGNILNSKQATQMTIERVKKIVSGELKQLKIGFNRYDKIVGGLYNNELVVCAARSGEGKCLGKGTKIIMYDGSIKKVENIVVNDLLMGANSSPRKVLSVTNGIDDMYEIKQNRAINYVVNSKHILSLKQSRNDKNSKNGTLVNISVKDYIKLSKKSKNNLKGYKVPVKFTKKKINQSLTGINVEYIGKDEYYGFMLDGDGLFLLEDGTVTHNSALALSIANHVAFVEKRKVAFFSLEMSIYETICRLVCQLTGLPFKNVYHGTLNDNNGWDKYNVALEKIRNSGIYFDETYGLTVPEIRSKIRKLKKEADIGLIIIDQLEQIRSYENFKTYLKFDKITYDIKDMTQEFNVPIILNHQLNRNITDRKLQDKTPHLSDLNQAGEKPANQVWVIQHEKDDQGRFSNSRINIIKNRNGPQMVFPVRFIGDRMLFANPSLASQTKEASFVRKTPVGSFSEIEEESIQQDIF